MRDGRENSNRLKPIAVSTYLPSTFWDTWQYHVSLMKRGEFARNLAAGTYDLIVLDVLRDGPCYGYGIRKRIFEQSKHAINWQDGTIYPVLRHLESQGLIAGSWNRPKRGHERRYYRLTARGQHVWREQRRQWNSFTRAVDALLSQ